MDAPVATDLLSGCWVILGGSTVRKKGNLTDSNFGGGEKLLEIYQVMKCTCIPNPCHTMELSTLADLLVCTGKSHDHMDLSAI